MSSGPPGPTAKILSETFGEEWDNPVGQMMKSVKDQTENDAIPPQSSFKTANLNQRVPTESPENLEREDSVVSSKSSASASSSESSLSSIHDVPKAPETGVENKAFSEETLDDETLPTSPPPAKVVNVLRLSIGKGSYVNPAADIEMAEVPPTPKAEYDDVVAPLPTRYGKRDQAAKAAFQKNQKRRGTEGHLQTGYVNSAAEDDYVAVDIPSANQASAPDSSQANTIITPEPEPSVAPPVSWRGMFRFAEKTDKILMIVGALFAVIQGVAFPCSLLLYREILNSIILSDISYQTIDARQNFCDFVCSNATQYGDENNCNSDSWNRAFELWNCQNATEAMDACATAVGYSSPMNYTILQNQTFFRQRNWICTGEPDYANGKVLPYVGGLIGVGISVMMIAFVHIFFWNMVAERQVCRIRIALFKSILSKHIGWFDVRDARALNSQLYDETSKLQDGLGEKISSTIQMVTTFITGFIISFAVNAELAGVVVSLVPLLLLTAGALTRRLRKFSTQQAEAYAKAGSLAVQTLGNVRTVTAFGRQEFEVDRYAVNLNDAMTTGIRKSIVTGLGQGIIWLILTSVQVLALWYGLNKLDGIQGGDVSLVILGIMIGSMQFGQAAPNLEIFATARAAAGQIFSIIDSPTKLDNFSQEGKQPKMIRGAIEVENVKFAYPKNKAQLILKGVSFSVQPGQTVALVGPSGSGKSTIIQILLRFYDAAAGRVKLDGEDITELNVNWLREQIGFVGQEPVLFSGSIADNIRMGKPNATQQEIEQAARLSNAHGFINLLPQKYDTFVGDRGAQLSGGQKQRIAIARGIIKNPKILLLDEATSALDTHSERVVQDALDRACAGRTTLVIAHRLSTIKNADLIIVVRDGFIVEAGKHADLMARGDAGVYYQLAKTQQLSEAVEQQSSKDEDEDSPEAIFKRLTHGSQRKRTSTITSRKDVKVETRRSSFTSIESEKNVEDEDEIDEAQAIANSAPVSIVMRWNSKEWCYILFGAIAATIAGFVYPMQAIIISLQLGNFAKFDKKEFAENNGLPVEPESIVEQDSQKYALAQLFFGIVLATSFTLQFALFGISGEKLTARLRKWSFAAMLRQDIQFFDRPENQPGSLAATLATDTTAVQGAAGSRIGVVLNLLANVGVAFVYGLVVRWDITLAAFSVIPIFIVANIFTVRVNMGAAKKDNKALKQVAQASTEAIGNMRTVVALGQQTAFLDLFRTTFLNIAASAKRKAAISAGAMGVANGMIFLSWSIVFGYGSALVDQRIITFVILFRIYNMSTFGGLAASRMAAYVPDLGKARVAAGKIFQLLHLEPEIDWTSTEGNKLIEFFGNVEFRNVHFHYPNRPDVKILRGLSFKAETGQTIALVGPSGCGKSTSLQLIERFYNPTSGDILIDGKPIDSINISSLRTKIGLIQQEPALFDATIWENITYGTIDDEKIDGEVPEGLIRRRTQHSVAFVDDLHDGFGTTVGDRGGQLSGGQKQRIAIARALARNPRLLLCDEATSALDNANEKLVQADIDAAREGRTCLIVAHRLATIQHADKILVFDKGRIAEQGRHEELLEKRGLYYALHMAQTLGGGH